MAKQGPENLDYTHVLLAPGQGNQRLGMGKDLADRIPGAKQVWETANESLFPKLGRNLTDIAWNTQGKDPKEAEAELQLTENAQLVVIVDALARTAALRDTDQLAAPGWHAGNSVGMIAALINAGSISIEAGVQLDQGRGEAMREAIKSGPPTTMLAMNLKELDRTVLKELRDPKGEYGLQTCLINSDQQYVLGGPVDVVERAVTELRERRIEDGIYQIPVDAAFHSKHMRGGVDRWKQVVYDTIVEAPQSGRVVGGSTVRELVTPDDIRRELVLQLTETERFRDMMWYLRSQGVVVMTELNATTRLTKINMDNFAIGREGGAPFVPLNAPKVAGEKTAVIGYRLTNPHSEVIPCEDIKTWYIEWAADRMGDDVEDIKGSDEFMRDRNFESEDLKALRADVRKKYRKIVPDDQAEENITIGAAALATYRLVNTPDAA